MVLLGCGLLLVVQAAVAGEGRGRSPTGAPPVVEPTVIGNLLVPVGRRLRFGFSLALLSLRTHRECAALFSELGADGLEVLAQTRYESASLDLLSGACGSGVPAYTKVGSYLIKLCPGFVALSVRGAALTVIHEALHSAGLSEKPADQATLTSREINRMVQLNCGF